jgi:AcrR family transcriptional regulator
MSSAYLPRENARMPVERWTPERRRQRTREALLDAATKVFAERGFQGASLDEIAATAGYTRGAIYKHFADKEELLHEVCLRLNERTFAEFDEIPIGRDWLDTSDLGAITSQWASMVERDTEFRVVMLEFQLHAYRNPQLRERALAFAQANRRAIADYLTQRVAESGEELPVDADRLAAVFGTSSDGFAQMALIDPDAASQYGLLLELVMRGLRSLADESPPSS